MHFDRLVYIILLRWLSKKKAREVHMELGKKIAEIRKEYSITQEALAEICCVTRQTISNWENGKSYPDLETLVLLSDTFDVSLDDLLKGDRKMVIKISKEQKRGRNAFRLVYLLVVIWYAVAFIPRFFYAYIPENIWKAANYLAWALNLTITILVLKAAIKQKGSREESGVIDALWFRWTVGIIGFFCYVASLALSAVRSVAFRAVFESIGSLLLWWLFFVWSGLFEDDRENGERSAANNKRSKVLFIVAVVLMAAALIMGVWTLISSGDRPHHSMFGEDYDAYLDQDIRVPDNFDGYKLNPMAVKRKGDDVTQDEQNAYRYFAIGYPNNEKVEIKGDGSTSYIDKGEKFELIFGKAEGNWMPYFSFDMVKMTPNLEPGNITNLEELEYKGAKIWVYERTRKWEDEDHSDYSWISPNMAEWQRKSIMEYTWTEFKDAEAFCYDQETKTFFSISYAGETFVAKKSEENSSDWDLVYERDYCMLTKEKALEYIKAVIDENR